MNSHLKSMFHGTQHVNSQITFAVAMTKSLPCLVKRIREKSTDDSLQGLLQQLSSKTSRDDGGCDEEPIAVLGNKTIYPANNHSIIVQEALRHNNMVGKEVYQFPRYSYGHKHLKSSQFDTSKTRNNITVLFQHEQMMCL
ncbi:uncharacterized protein LOC117315246 [Pecten maximus]|uniref:uncharacterized protein LOC117315246 n=1 Tax=Pecten maximus TaxID=6579 RepID=UPI0014583442|nr:uncharacterized protein LOC117315246 [Pecten maximus]